MELYPQTGQGVHADTRVSINTYHTVPNPVALLSSHVAMEAQGMNDSDAPGAWLLERNTPHKGPAEQCVLC